MWSEIYDRLGITPDDAQFWRRLIRRETQRAAHRNQREREERVRFAMGVVAYHSGNLEGAAWNRWELHRDALLDAYRMGQRREPVTIYNFLMWHKAILPFGGSFRQGNPVSMHMGESFAPAPVRDLPRIMNEFVRTWLDGLDDWHALAERHFRQWQVHPFPDGNKRHCRLMTIYGCGWLGLDPVCITLDEKHDYLNALQNGDADALAALFKARQFHIE